MTEDTPHETPQNRGQHFSWNLPADQRRVFWADSAKERKSGWGGKVSIWIKLQLPSEQVLWWSQIGGSVFGRFKYSTGIPCVFMGISQADMLLGQCLSNSWPAILWQQRVPNWGSSSSGSHSYWWQSRRCPEDNLPHCLNSRRFICWALVVTLTPMEAIAVPLLSWFFCISVVLAATSVSFLILFIGESESDVAQLCPTLCDPVDCSPPGSSVHEILQARILEWVAISFSWLKVYQFCLSLKKKKPALSFMGLFYCFLGLYFICFFSDVYDFLPSSGFGICLFFFF